MVGDTGGEQIIQACEHLLMDLLGFGGEFAGGVGACEESFDTAVGSMEADEGIDQASKELESG